MESYEQAVDLALMVVNLDKTIFQTMSKRGLVQYLNSQYSLVLKVNNKHELDKFTLASKILLNDIAVPVAQCNASTERGSCLDCATVNEDENQVNYKTPVFEEALMSAPNVTNSNVTKYLDGFNSNTFNPRISRMSQPLDTIGLYQDNTHQSIMNYSNSIGFGPEAKVRVQEHFNNPTTHPVADARNAYYSQYSRVFVNDNGEGYLDEEETRQVNNETPNIQRNHRQLHNGRFM